MNKDQIKGTIKGAAGKMQEAAGKATGSTEQQMKGIHKQAEGKVQQVAGDLKQTVKDATSK